MRGQPASAAPPGGQLVPVAVQQPGAEALQQAGAAVGVRAAADAEHELAAAGVQRRRDQLAGAAAGARWLERRGPPRPAGAPARTPWPVRRRPRRSADREVGLHRLAGGPG